MPTRGTPTSRPNMAVCRAVLGTNTEREKNANDSVKAVMTSAPTSGGMVMPIPM